MGCLALAPREEEGDAVWLGLRGILLFVVGCPSAFHSFSFGRF
jgi:hypothetical protein